MPASPWPVANEAGHAKSAAFVKLNELTMIPQRLLEVVDWPPPVFGILTHTGLMAYDRLARAERK